VTPRNTSTGGVLEAVIVPALKRGGYRHEKQVNIGTRCGGGIHEVDAVARQGTDEVIYAGLVKVVTLEAVIRLADNGEL
jgi:hypothetical protein